MIRTLLASPEDLLTDNILDVILRTLLRYNVDPLIRITADLILCIDNTVAVRYTDRTRILIKFGMNKSVYFGRYPEIIRSVIIDSKCKVTSVRSRADILDQICTKIS